MKLLLPILLFLASTTSAVEPIIYYNSYDTRFINASGDETKTGKLTIEGQLKVETTIYPVGHFVRNTALTGGAFGTNTGVASGFLLETVSSGDMTDGFGGGFVFAIKDNAAVQRVIAKMYARRDGADAAGMLEFWTGTSGLTPTMALRASGKIGIGTSAPSAYFHIQTPSGIDSKTEYSLKISSGDETSVFGIHPDGHISIYGADATLGTCTNGTIVGHDTAGKITFSGANNSCAVVFGTEFDNVPVCVLTGKLTAFNETPTLSAEATTGITIEPATGSWESGDAINFICLGSH